MLLSGNTPGEVTHSLFDYDTSGWKQDEIAIISEVINVKRLGDVINHVKDLFIKTTRKYLFEWYLY